LGEFLNMRKLQKGDILVAKDVCRMNNASGEEALIIGKEYVVDEVDEKYNTFTITSELGRHSFDIEDEHDGLDFYFNTFDSLQVKILEWYNKTKDEKFAEFFGLERKRYGNI